MIHSELNWTLILQNKKIIYIYIYTDVIAVQQTGVSRHHGVPSNPSDHHSTKKREATPTNGSLGTVRFGTIRGSGIGPVGRDNVRYVYIRIYIYILSTYMFNMKKNTDINALHLVICFCPEIIIITKYRNLDTFSIIAIEILKS